MDHTNYQKKVQNLTIAELNYIILDCKEAIQNLPDNPKNGDYQDEIHYCAAELQRRRKALAATSGTLGLNYECSNLPVGTWIPDNFAPCLRSQIMEHSREGARLGRENYSRVVSYAELEVMVYGV